MFEIVQVAPVASVMLTGYPGMVLTQEQGQLTPDWTLKCQELPGTGEQRLNSPCQLA